MRVVTDYSDPVEGAAEALGVALELHKSRPVLLLLSGGSALAVLDRLPASVFGADLTIAMIDERWSHEPTINNFAQLMALSFFERRTLAGATFFDSRPHAAESPAHLAARFDTFLRDWYVKHPHGVTIANLGMGADGHTAGIFPGYVAALDAAGKWVENCTLAPEINPYPERVTVTPQFLTSKIDQAVALVSGTAKHSVLQAVINQESAPEIYPANLWHQMCYVTLVSDYVR